MAKTSNAKQKICEHAQHLFDIKGYDQVSLREIAEAAGTTIGNLTYHFPQKENLIAAMQQDLHAGFANDFYISENGEEILMNLVESFREAQINEEGNQFYFRNLVELSKDSKAIAEENEQFREQLYCYYSNCLAQLVDKGLMRSDILESQYRNLSYVMVVMSSVWIQNTLPFYDKNISSPPISVALTDLIFPYLTERGRSFFNDNVNDVDLKL
jgi:AcrR family transcriptional regulator